MRAEGSRRLVVDADVAQRCAREEVLDPGSICCREFLEAVLRICHHVVLAQELIDEWQRHGSRFFRRWFRQMASRHKVAPVQPRRDEGLRERLPGTATSEAEIEAMLKDVHLIEAATAADQVIISLDDRARRLFGRAAQRIRGLRNVMWVNPCEEPEALVTWLEAGASAEDRLTLGFRQEAGSRGRRGARRS